MTKVSNHSTEQRAAGVIVAPTAQDVFESYATRLGWDNETQMHVLVHWCDADLIEPLLQYIQGTKRTEDFVQFLADNFGDDRLEGNKLKVVESVSECDHPGSDRRRNQTTTANQGSRRHR
jgi:hypothetical protein